MHFIICGFFVLFYYKYLLYYTAGNSKITITLKYSFITTILNDTVSFSKTLNATVKVVIKYLLS